MHTSYDDMAFSIRLTEQEKRTAGSYARLHSLTLGEAFKQALFEKFEDGDIIMQNGRIFNENNPHLSGDVKKQIKKEDLHNL